MIALCNPVYCLLTIVVRRLQTLPTLSRGRSNVGFPRTTGLRARIMSAASSPITAVSNVHEGVVRVLKMPSIIRRLQRDVKVELG